MARASAVAMTTPETGSLAPASPPSQPQPPWVGVTLGMRAVRWPCGRTTVLWRQWGGAQPPGLGPTHPVEGLSCKPVARRQHWDLWHPVLGSSHPLLDPLPFTHVMDTGMVGAPHQGEARALRSWERAPSLAAPTATCGRTRVQPQCLTGVGWDWIFMRLSGDMPCAGGW